MYPTSYKRRMATRSPQVVSTKKQRKLVIEWMINQVEDCGTDKEISIKATQKFKTIFKIRDERSRKACIRKANRWWNGRDEFLNALSTKENGTMCLRSKNVPGIAEKRCAVKAFQGRGRKRNDWVTYLHQVLLSEFERLCSSDVRLSRALIQKVALSLLEDENSDYMSTDVDPTTGRPITEHLTMKWVDSFLNRFNIVVRKQSGSLSRSPSQTAFIERNVSYHLGCLQRLFDAKLLDENLVENMDETHFVFNMDNGKTLGFRGSTKVNYADVVSGCDGFTMVLRLRGGVGAKLMQPFLIFKNRDRNYPMANLPDNINGVSYRTQPRAWMDNVVFEEWLREPRAIDRDADNRTRYLYMDNCSGHKQTDNVSNALLSINTEIEFLPRNATHLCQPLDSFIIQKLKCVWRREWEQKRNSLILSNNWSDGPRSSGKILNPGKPYFMNLAVKCVSEVNAMMDHDGIPLVRKAMIRCGLALNTNGCWEIAQLFQHLQDIIQRYPMEFAGNPVQ